MKNLINFIFDALAKAFDSIPGLNKLEGYRSILGFVGLAVIAGLRLKGVGDPETLDLVAAGFSGWTILALNAKGRE